MLLLIYITKTVFISGLLLGYYWLFLRNRFFHGFNRIFLLAIPVLGFIVPALHFNLPVFWNQNAGGSPIRLLGVGRGDLEEAVTVYANRRVGSGFSWEVSLGIFTGIISCSLFLRFYKTLRFLHRLKKDKPSLLLPEATIYFVSEKGTPFSYFKNIFWGKEMEIHSVAGRQILRHELFHVKNNHSLDILTMELLSIIFWFNPFFHMIRRELQAIHEYGADAYAAADTDEYEYASLLLLKVSGLSIPLTHPFFKNQIKRRIAMITKTNKNKKALLGRFMILPMIAILIGMFSFKIQNHFHLSNSKSIRVVIDAGHGGSFNGAESNGLLEKNINLIIAKKIQSLSGAYNVDVIMSRETDVTPGSNQLRESLEYIAALPKSKNADLFISIHTNLTENGQEGKTQTSRSGFQIYIPRNSSEVYEGSLKLGSIITEVIKSDYLIEPELKQTRGDGGNILILKKATVPALLIECGYMDNPSDLKYLLDEKNQEKIARDILEGIRKYSLQSTSYHPALPSNTVISESVSSNLQVENNEEIKENASDSTGPYKTVDVTAEYPGGNYAWGQYILRTLNYPKDAVKNSIQGDVVVEFVVRKDGSITDIHVISGPEELRAESIRVISKSGHWIPAIDHGMKVDSYCKQPINYRLQ